MSNNLVLVIGGTGAQGSAVVEQLVSDKKYRVRIVTRDPNSRRAQELAQLPGVEFFKGSITDENDLVKAFKGVDLAFVNIDGFAIGEKAEIYWGIRIFELAIQAGTVRHFVWGSLDYAFQKGGYNPKYRCGHYDGKGKVAQFLRGQPQGKMIWSVLTSGPYMDMLSEFLKPQVIDGTYTFIAPIGTGAMPLIALEDLGFYGRWIFDHPEKSAGLDLEVASEKVTWDYLAKTFTEVTGKPAKYMDVPLEAYMGTIKPDFRVGPADGMSWIDNFSGFFNLWHDDVIKRDYKMLSELHPNHLTLKTWMQKVKYDGEPRHVLKIIEEGWNPRK